MDFYAKIIDFFLLFTNIKQKSATFGFFFTEIFESVGRSWIFIRVFVCLNLFHLCFI
jgi:hypothetical protein